MRGEDHIFQPKQRIILRWGFGVVTVDSGETDFTIPQRFSQCSPCATDFTTPEAATETDTDDGDVFCFENKTYNTV